MLHGFFPSYFEWWHLPVVFLGGLIGESIGALVGGGSIVTMPALLLTGAPLHSAIAIDNAASLATEAGIISETWHKIVARKRLVVLMAIPMTLGGIIGTWLLLNISADVIRYIMAGTVLFLLIHSYMSKSPHPDDVSRRNYILLTVFLFLIGIYSNFIAAGEGAFSRMGIMAILGLPFVESTGLKATATTPSRIYLLIVTAFVGLIVWPYLLTMWVGNFIAGKYSTKFVKKVPDHFLKPILTLMSIGFVVYLVFFY
ncbi:MAG TPA: sulfite exporter TauE/SafE family protein [Candidatus Saccharimonadales bacterium]